MCVSSAAGREGRWASGGTCSTQPSHYSQKKDSSRSGRHKMGRELGRNIVGKTPFPAQSLLRFPKVAPSTSSLFHHLILVPGKAWPKKAFGKVWEHVGLSLNSDGAERNPRVQHSRILGSEWPQRK